MIELAPRYRPLRILCVEEDAIERKLLQACLDAVRIEAMFADSAAQAVWLFRKHPVDMVFIDIDRHAPGELGGYRRMRATPRRWNNVPILAFTNNDANWTEEEYRRAGFGGMFQKPIEPTRLFHKIDDIVCERGLAPLLLPQGRVPSMPHIA
jgi:CheY-like chemotaxis protein